MIPVVVSGKGQRGGETCSWYLELKNCKIKFRNRNRRILYFDRVGQTGLLTKLAYQFSLKKIPGGSVVDQITFYLDPNPSSFTRLHYHFEKNVQQRFISNLFLEKNLRIMNGT